MSEIVLKVEDLHTSFFTRSGEFRAVDGVSFHVREAETFGLVGESACGKTVTGLSILRLLPEPAGKIVSGKITLDGTNILELSKKEMRAYRGAMISMILQDPMTSLNPVYTVGNQIAEPVRQHQRIQDKNMVEEKVISALRLLRIPAPERRLQDYPFQMSGGMRQRVVGSIAMSCYPRLLIADEPTTALDATIQAQYIALFKDVQKETDVAIIFITHDFGVVANMCHRVGVMYAGKIVETAATSTIFKAPRHPYTNALIHSVPRLDRKDDRLYSIEGQPPSLLNLPPGCRFAPRCPDVMDICNEQQPQEVEISEGHSVSCWKVK
ncbi:MAG: ABC transporter ATP-binding protein [Dehalococcoidales bacterium]|nr:MAG: ABC transporter ATP-binding protein [Dehalococcoidales bacterium]